MRAAPGTYAVTPLAAAIDPRLGKLALRLAILMASYRNKDGQCWPAVETLARRLGVDRRAVQRGIAELIECGHIARTRRTLAGRGQASNSYTVLYRVVELAENPAGEGEDAENGQMAPLAPNASGEPVCQSVSHAVEITAPAPAVDPERLNSPPPCGQTVHPGAVNLTAPGAAKMDQPGRSNSPPKEESKYTIEEESEDEEDARARQAAAAPAHPSFKSEEDEAVFLFNEVARRVGWVSTQHLTSKVRKSLGNRLGEAGGLQGWRDALAKGEASNFLTLKMRPTLSLDWLVHEDHFASLMHGRYDAEHDPPEKKSKIQKALDGIDLALARHHEREAYAPIPVPEPVLPPPEIRQFDTVNMNLKHIGSLEGRTPNEMVELAYQWANRLVASGLRSSEAREAVAAAVAESVATEGGTARIEELVAQQIERERAAA